MNCDLAALIFQAGKVVEAHSGKDNHREYCGLLDGKPWLYPGEIVIEYQGKLYVCELPREYARNG